MTETIDLAEGLVTVPRPTFHFYLHSGWEWRTGNNLHSLMRDMDRQKHTYWVWLVPGPADQRYEIQFYRPQVEGAYVIAQVVYEKGRLVK